MSKYLPEEVARDILEMSRNPLKGFDWKNATPEKLVWANAVKKNMEDAEPIEEDFRQNGIIIYSTTELQIQEHRQNEKVIKMAIKWLKKIENNSLKGSLLDAIAANDFFAQYKQEIMDLFISLWKDTNPTEYGLLRNSLAHYLWKYYDDKYFFEMRDFYTGQGSTFPLKDELESDGRFYLVLAMAKTKKYRKEAATVIEQTPVTISTVIDSIKALGRLGQSSSILYLEKLLNDKDEKITELAQKSIDKIKQRNRT